MSVKTFRRLSKLARSKVADRAADGFSRTRNNRGAGGLVETLERRAMLSAAPAATPTHLTIIPTFDSSITKDPNATAIKAAINAAINDFEANFSTPITVKILFKEEADGLGSSTTQFQTVTYSAYRAALVAHATDAADASAIAQLPNTTTNPVNGGANVEETLPALRALGFTTATGSDSTIALNTSICNFTRTSVDPEKYDLQSVTEHEMDEVLGGGSELDGRKVGDDLPTDIAEPLDFYRYDGNNARSFTTDPDAVSYFSIDGGKTRLAQFNQDDGGDFGDWYSVNGDQLPQVQDAFNTPGAVPNLNAELTRLDVLGYTRKVVAATGIFPVSETIGTPKQSGDASFSNGTYTLHGPGSDIFRISDQFEYDFTRATGNTTIIANVNTLARTSTWAKAGVMIRASTDANSAFADVVVTAARGVAFQWRTSDGAFAQSVDLPGYHAAQFVKLVRSGNVFSGYLQAANGTWIKIGHSVTIAMPGEVRAGLAVSSVNPNVVTMATFTNVSLTTQPAFSLAAPVANSLVATKQTDDAKTKDHSTTIADAVLK